LHQPSEAFFVAGGGGPSQAAQRLRLPTPPGTTRGLLILDGRYSIVPSSINEATRGRGKARWSTLQYALFSAQATWASRPKTGRSRINRTRRPRSRRTLADFLIGKHCFRRPAQSANPRLAPATRTAQASTAGRYHTDWRCPPRRDRREETAQFNNLCVRRLWTRPRTILQPDGAGAAGVRRDGQLGWRKKVSAIEAIGVFWPRGATGRPGNGSSPAMRTAANSELNFKRLAAPGKKNRHRAIFTLIAVRLRDGRVWRAGRARHVPRLGRRSSEASSMRIQRIYLAFRRGPARFYDSPYRSTRSYRPIKRSPIVPQRFPQ